MSHIPHQWNLHFGASEEEEEEEEDDDDDDDDFNFSPESSPLMEDDPLTLLSDLDVLLSDFDDIPQTLSKDNTPTTTTTTTTTTHDAQLATDDDHYNSCISYINYGDFAKVQQPLPRSTPLPVYINNNNNNNNASIEGPCPCVRKKAGQDKGSAGKVVMTKVAAGEEADKEIKAAEKEKEDEDEDRPKRRRTAEQHSVYERKRRSRIQERLRTLQEMVPNASKLTKSSMLDETIKHIKGLQLHLQMMKEHGLGFQSQCIEMSKIQKMQSTTTTTHQCYSTCINPMRSPPSGEGYAHGHGTVLSPPPPAAGFYPPMSPEVEMSAATGVFPYYYDYPLEPIFPAADGSPLPPVVTAEIWAHISPSSQNPMPPVVPPAQVLAHVSPSNNHPEPPMLPVLRQVYLANQGEAIYHGLTMPNVDQMPRTTTAQGFCLLNINVPEEASTSHYRNRGDNSYNLYGLGQTNSRN